MIYLGRCSYCGAPVQAGDGIRSCCDRCRALDRPNGFWVASSWVWDDQQQAYREVVQLVPPPPPPPIETPSRSKRLPDERPEVLTARYGYTRDTPNEDLTLVGVICAIAFIVLVLTLVAYYG